MENGQVMAINTLLLPEFDQEMKSTRATLERVPAENKDFSPHPKSMPLGRLATHVAELSGFGLTILTTPELDFSKDTRKRMEFESVDQVLKAFDEGSAKVRSTLASMPDDSWNQPWKLSFQGKKIFE